MAASKILDGIFICYDSQSEKQRKTVPSKKQSICSPVNLPAPPLTYTSHALLYLMFYRHDSVLVNMVKKF